MPLVEAVAGPGRSRTNSKTILDSENRESSSCEVRTDQRRR